MRCIFARMARVADRQAGLQRSVFMGKPYNNRLGETQLGASTTIIVRFCVAEAVAGAWKNGVVLQTVGGFASPLALPSRSLSCQKIVQGGCRARCSTFLPALLRVLPLLVRRVFHVAVVVNPVPRGSHE